VGVFTMELVHVLKSRAAKCLHLAVRPEGANHQWRKIPPGELSIDPVANERLGRVTGLEPRDKGRVCTENQIRQYRW